MPSSNSSKQKKPAPRVNLRSERERRSLTIKDIHIRVGIPLDHIEALESGVVPQALRGKKLLRSKQAYLCFLGFPKHSKLDVRRKKRRSTGYSKQDYERTGSTEIAVPTTTKSIFTGFGLAVAVVLGLKTLSVAMDNPAFSLEGLMDSMINNMNAEEPQFNTVEQPTEAMLATVRSQSGLTSTNAASSLTTNNTATLLQNNIDGLVDNIIEAEEEIANEPHGPHEISIKVYERSKLFFMCDGYLLHKGYVQRGDIFECNFRGKAIVDMTDPSAAKITHDEKLVQPMGPQGNKRRLSFVHSPY